MSGLLLQQDRIVGWRIMGKKEDKEEIRQQEFSESGYYRQEDYYSERDPRYSRGEQYSRDGQYGRDPRYSRGEQYSRDGQYGRDPRYSRDGQYRRSRPEDGRYADENSPYRYNGRMYGRENGRYDREHGVYRGPQYYREPRRKKKKKWPIVVGILLAIVLAVFAFIFIELGRMDRTTLKNILTNSGVSNTGYRDIALYGVDSRDGNIRSGTNSDTIMVCSINNATKEIKLVSVYRDTYLDNTDGNYRKATECYSVGGAEQSVNMLNKNLDLDIEDFVTVDFAAVIKTVDLVGGVDLNITDQEMELINGYCVENKQVTGVDYTPLTASGDVHLSGIQALAYCRIRYTEGWDFKRTERQRTVLTQCFEKAKNQGVTTLASIVNTMLPYIYTSMSNTDILSLATSAGSFKLEEGNETGFPYETAFTTLSNGADIVVPVTLADNVSKLHSFLYGQEGYQPSDTVQEISQTIINDTGISSVS